MLRFHHRVFIYFVPGLTVDAKGESVLLKCSAGVRMQKPAYYSSGLRKIMDRRLIGRKKKDKITAINAFRCRHAASHAERR